MSHTYIHTHIHTFRHTYVHTCTHTYTHTYVHIFMDKLMTSPCISIKEMLSFSGGALSGGEDERPRCPAAAEEGSDRQSERWGWSDCSQLRLWDEMQWHRSNTRQEQCQPRLSRHPRYSPSFIHSGHFYSAPSSPLLLRSAPDIERILCRSTRVHKYMSPLPNQHTFCYGSLAIYSFNY